MAQEKSTKRCFVARLIDGKIIHHFETKYTFFHMDRLCYFYGQEFTGGLFSKIKLNDFDVPFLEAKFNSLFE